MKVIIRAALLAATLVPGPAWADRAYTRFAIHPDPSVAEAEVPLGDFVVSYVGTYEGMARLEEPYLLNPKDASEGKFDAGEELFQSWRDGELFYCATKRIATGIPLTPGTIVRAALGVHLFGGSMNARENNWQCFRDADGDGRFEQVGGGDRGMHMPPHITNLSEVTKLEQPLRYSLLDAASLKPAITIGLLSTIRDAKSGRFGLQLCIRSSDPAETYCPRPGYTSFNASSLPDTMEVLDGQIKITAMRTDEAGQAHIRYTFEKPVKAAMISLSHSGWTDPVTEEKLWFWDSAAPLEPPKPKH